ncbi:MAG: electron transfer flavoprotein subunit beta/FixA family protein [Saprospiraceae bacterium]|nr:electron transfer flavoprotein subunit beta/FixA family protein [Saprospiraceae bacterium]MBK6565588.1 electron transfer flavoprotein subunit beta/FixA family protein [Saprospiraceae bacterium]MBK8370520.1 electron transfer flavoprotein subunit beta/FixA family protein [Saprospiraceae bacterium]MBK8546556.1 electron transfer flavoprotein subunit beta/FixA family protein [Saprospiraceae bacterium]MBK8817678.1 electron transfer flavoprotein subunit beta/FixA family protein [Saprospiraceae bact
MNILVCISKTPDTTSKISFKSENKEYNPDGISFIMNPYDEWYALVRAIELVEQNGGNVTTITVGDASNDMIIRKGLAIGANDAIRIDINPKEPFEAAFQIAEASKQKPYDLILLGKETIDYNGSILGSILAELLHLPFISFATKLELSGKTFTVTREIEGGEEICQVEGPCVISAAKGMAEQRIPNMKGIMTSKSKPLNVMAPVAYQNKVEVLTFTLPGEKKGVKMLSPDQMDELVALLHEEAKVI